MEYAAQNLHKAFRYSRQILQGQIAAIQLAVIQLVLYDFPDQALNLGLGLVGHSPYSSFNGIGQHDHGGLPRIGQWTLVPVVGFLHFLGIAVLGGHMIEIDH